MKTYSVVLSYFDGQRHVESAESAGLAAMLQLAGLICQHATDKVSSVEVWEADGIGTRLVVFSWSPKGVVAVKSVRNMATSYQFVEQPGYYL
jgi:hypothetical protein